MSLKSDVFTVMRFEEGEHFYEKMVCGSWFAIILNPEPLIDFVHQLKYKTKSLYVVLNISFSLCGLI